MDIQRLIDEMTIEEKATLLSGSNCLFVAIEKTTLSAGTTLANRMLVTKALPQDVVILVFVLFLTSGLSDCAVPAGVHVFPSVVSVSEIHN